jgi:2-methylcitrate dehydratase PrpD
MAEVADSSEQVDTASMQPRGRLIAEYVATASGRNFPPEIVEAAKVALIDHVGVAVGACNEPAALATRRVAESWKSDGRARIFNGPTTSAALAALVNGTMAHCMDFDDTHIHGGGHISAPCWSASLAVATDRDLDETTALSGFITGFEVMARIGGGSIKGIGRNMQRRGIHPTGVLGPVGAAAAVAAMLGFDGDKVANALGAAATSGSGFVASFGTDSKPFHAGRSAMEGILAADLAASGFTAAKHLFERDGGMIDAFIQDGNVQVPELDFTSWELTNNGYKPFACCRATHPSIQAAQTLKDRVGNRPIKRVAVKVHATALFTAGKREPKTPLECKFSLPFCIAMGLRGYRGVATDFSDDTLRDQKVQAIVPKVEMQPVADQPQHEAYLDVWLEDGEHLKAETKYVLGHPDNPMSDADLRAKFASLVEPVFGKRRCNELYDTLTHFERPGSLQRVVELTAAA